MRRDGHSASVEERGAFGVERTALLRTLQALAAEAGATVETGTNAPPTDGFAADAVIFADGVGSQGREALAARFGAEVATVPLSYIWCGARIGLDAMTLDLHRSEHGVFCGHVMPYGEDRVTFQIDTLTERWTRPTWPNRSSIPTATAMRVPCASCRTLSHPCCTAPGSWATARWSRFRLVKCERWSAGNVVLVGDAAHTAHYTVGSGTRMAMEDAIVLSQALIGEGSLDAAFESYEKERRPAVEHLQRRADRSQVWWRTLAHRYDLPLPVLLLSYFTRTGSVDLDRLARSNPEIVEAAIEHRWRGATPAQAEDSAAGATAATLLPDRSARQLMSGRILDRSDLDGHVDEIACDNLTPWSAETSAIAHRLGGREHNGSAPDILLTGSDDHRHLLDRFDIAEEMRVLTGATAAATGSSSRATWPSSRRARLIASGAERTRRQQPRPARPPEGLLGDHLTVRAAVELGAETAASVAPCR